MEKYVYSMKVNDALERFGAKTHGSLERRVERLKRFTDMKNKQYAKELEKEKYPPVFLRRNINNQFLKAIDKRENALKQSRVTFAGIEKPTGLNLLWEAIQNGHVNPNRG